MARVLAYTAPGRGHLFPIVPVLDELKVRGHSVSLYCLGSAVAEMRKRGFESEAVDPAIEAIEYDDWRGNNPREALALSVKGIFERAALDFADLRAAIDACSPDVIIVDANCWGAACEAEVWGGPRAIYCPYPLPISSKDAPPFGLALPPARGPIGRLRDRLLRPLAVGGLEKKLLPSMNNLRERMNLSPIDGVDALFATFPLILSMTAEPFEYHRTDWPENVVMIGACAWEPPSEPPDWLKGIDRPIVLVTTSSEFQDDGALVATALEALKDEPVAVVATLPAGDPEAFDVPANAYVERFVPHGPVLDRAVCAVTHGGMGATQKALSRGVPVCVVPFGRDQPEVARRTAVAKAGTFLSAKRLNAPKLREKVREAITMTEGAQRVKRGFSAAGEGIAAADAIEQRLLSGSLTPSSPADTSR
ncbi:MAG: glycosyltransferase [Actinobacteria bacterium]|nr:glycosyltransferase [Actinomycetota bacterium]